MALRYALPATGTHAWLRTQERRLLARPGLSALRTSSSLANHSQPRGEAEIQIDQRVGLASDWRAAWEVFHSAEDAPTGVSTGLEHAPGVRHARLVWDEFGLPGQDGPLPTQWSERFIQAPYGTPAAAFLNALTQRLAHLYYRVWAHRRPECEWGHCDNRLRAVLERLAGTTRGTYAHLAWAKPQLSMLAVRARLQYGVDLSVSRRPVALACARDPARPGRSRLNAATLGAHVCVHADPACSIRIDIVARDAEQFRNLRSSASLVRRAISALVAHSLPPESIEWHVSAPECLPASRLGTGRIGFSRVGFHERDSRYSNMRYTREHPAHDGEPVCK